MTDEEALKLAEEHWKFLEERYHMMFLDGWLHGVKHEREDKEGTESKK